MEVIELSYPIKHIEIKEPTVLALGYFDGIHIGHQKVIQTAKEIAVKNHYKCGIMTFHPHPSVVLGKKQKTVEYITPMEQKQRIAESLGVDYFYLVHFNHQFAELLPQEFVDQYIIDLNIKHVVAGFDYTYGRMGKGNMESLPFHSRQQSEQTVVDKIELDGEKVSSTLIRQYIIEGKFGLLKPYLGRNFEMNGKVVHGDARGRTIGFPTANVEPTDRYIMPKTGVYAVKMKVDDKWYEGVCNVGYKPTFNQEMPDKPTIEVHLFEFDLSIYGKDVIVEWCERIRSEKKFNGVNELVAQIERDKEEAIQYFKNT